MWCSLPHSVFAMIYTATITVLLFASTWARPTPAVSNSTGTLTFLVVGDWGGQNTSPYYTAAQKDVAAAMGKTAQTLGSQFTVSVGDNFYDVGATDVNDPRFKETFEVQLLMCICVKIISTCRITL